MKRKRAKPFNATGRAVKDLEADNWTVGTIFSIKKDAVESVLRELERP